MEVCLILFEFDCVANEVIVENYDNNGWPFASRWPATALIDGCGCGCKMFDDESHSPPSRCFFSWRVVPIHSRGLLQQNKHRERK